MAPDSIAAAVARYLDTPQQNLEAAKESLARAIERTTRIRARTRGGR